MAGVCNTNAILSGLIDYYCLVCEDLFQNVEDVHQHVDTPHHNKILQQTYYVNEYTEHRIRKLRKGYFCEYCNEAFTKSSNMRSHVDTETHVYRRDSKQFSSSRSVLNLSCSGNKVLTSQLLIDQRPWNGILNDDTCLVCDKAIDSFEDHKKSWCHVLKLAQTKILVGKDEISRKISNDLYQCLICNIMCSVHDYDKHNTTESHIMNYTKAIQSTPVSTDNGHVAQTSFNYHSCKESIKIENDTKVNQNSKENTQDIKLDEQAGGVLAEDERKINTTTEQDQTLSIKVEDAVSFADANNLTYIESVNTANCNICKVMVPFNLTNMKKHVNEIEHKNKMAKTENRTAEQNQSEEQEIKEKAKRSQETIIKVDIEVVKCYRTEMFEDFVHKIAKAKNLLTGIESVLINGHICLKMESFAMITKVGIRPMCQLCNKILHNFDDLKRHYKSYIKTNGVKTNHKDAQKKVLVLKGLGHEFVREVRPAEFHCGYCNIVVPGWEDLNLHLNSTVHIRMKVEAKRKSELINTSSNAKNEMEILNILTVMHVLNAVERF